jgi:hypothetical protein
MCHTFPEDLDRYAHSGYLILKMCRFTPPQHRAEVCVMPFAICQVLMLAML